jgi:hypothetical protein
MKYVVYLVLMTFFILLASFSAHSIPRQGTYESPSGQGTLTIKRNAKGTVWFTLDAVGSNFHTCSIEGVVKGNIGYPVPADQNDLNCKLNLLNKGISIDLRKAPDACRLQYCGVRAFFDNIYTLPLPSCRRNIRAQTLKRIDALFLAGQYDKLNAVGVRFYRQCISNLYYDEADDLANKIAVTYQKRGDNKSCLQILSKTLAVSLYKDEYELKKMPPGNYAGYKDTALAIWLTQSQCANP